MTMIHVKCPNCEQSIEMPEEGRGEQVTCPTCQQEFTAWELEGQGREGAIERAQAGMLDGAKVMEEREISNPKYPKSEISKTPAPMALPADARDASRERRREAESEWRWVKGHARFLSTMAIAAFVCAILCCFLGIAVANGGPGAPSAAGLFWTAGALGGAAVFLAVVAQLFHIRAAVERMAER